MIRFDSENLIKKSNVVTARKFERILVVLAMSSVLPDVRYAEPSSAKRTGGGKLCG
jgi:hypothetical protein